MKFFPFCIPFSDHLSTGPLLTGAFIHSSSISAGAGIPCKTVNQPDMFFLLQSVGHRKLVRRPQILVWGEAAMEWVLWASEPLAFAISGPAYTQPCIQPFELHNFMVLISDNTNLDWRIRSCGYYSISRHLVTARTQARNYSLKCLFTNLPKKV